MFSALSPLIAIAAGVIVLMIQTAIRRNTNAAMLISFASLLAALWLCLTSWPEAPIEATPLLVVDGYARLFTVVLIFAAVVTVVVGRAWTESQALELHEFLMLTLVATFGALTLVHAQHFAAFLLGLEILGVSVYALVAYPDKAWLPLEAGLKYLVLSSASTATLLFGFAILYAATGVLGFTELGQHLAQANTLLVGVAALMIVTGLGFKLSLVPFHMWTPDVYEGAPTPVSGFLATVAKVAIFVALLRWYDSAGLRQQTILTEALAWLAIGSMLVGNFLALKQDNLKRLLGYSSIAHMGYLLVTLVVLGSLQETALAMEAAVWYVIAYTAGTMSAFTVLSIWQSRYGGSDNCDREALSGLFWREPLLALVMTVALLSLAGVPLTAGFVGKFYVIAAGIDAQLWLLLAALVAGSAVSIFYYLRVIYTFSMNPVDEPAAINAGQTVFGLVFAGLLIAVLVLGIYPEPLIEVLARVL